MKRLSFVAMALALLTLSCGGRQAAAPADTTPADTADTTATDSVEPVDTLEQLIAETPMPRAADELFDDFLFNFAANRNLQMERVNFPLPNVRNGKTTQVGRDEWKMERFFMRQDYYTVLFDNQQQMELVRDTSVSQATVEKIYFNTGAVIQYQFRRIKGAWMLLEVRTEPIASNRNASFLDFYHQFVTDSAFQTESLAQTVAFVGPDPDDDFAQMEGILTPDTWPAFAPELPDRMIYNIVYGKQEEDSDEKIFMMRGIANGMEVEMTFRRSDGQWKLVKMRE
ncbi:MAG: DUF4348 domain-containing protein [Prevotella sp.]|nr:DUF4348 domain-containing protein [Prevotella sp.]